MSNRKSYSMRANSLDCSARRSMAAILALARWLDSVMSRRISPNHSRSSGVTSEPNRCSIAGSNSTSNLASSRSVGISSMPRKSLSRFERPAAGSTERETSDHRGRPGIAGRGRVPTPSPRSRSSRSLHRGCPPPSLRMPPTGRGTSASPRASLAGNRMRTPDPREVERAAPERLLPLLLPLLQCPRESRVCR